MVQASPRPLRISSANSKLAGWASASDQATFGDTEVQVQYLSLRNICVSEIFQLILKIIIPTSDISRWFPKVDGIPASRGGVRHAVRRLDDRQHTKSVAAGGFRQRGGTRKSSMGHGDEYTYKLKNALCRNFCQLLFMSFYNILYQPLSPYIFIPN